MMLQLLRLLDPAYPTLTQATSPWRMWGFDLEVFLHLAWVGMFVVFPTRVKWRSPRGVLVVIVGGLALAAGLLWSFGRPLVWDDWPNGRFGDRITLLGRMTSWEGLYLGIVALIAVSVYEMRDRPVGERRARALLLVGLFAHLFARMGRASYEMVVDQITTGDVFATVSYLRGTVHDDYQVSLAVHAFTFVATLATSLWIWRLTGSKAPFLVAIFSLALVALTRWSNSAWGFQEHEPMLMAVIVMIAAQRRQAFGALLVPAPVARALAFVAAASVFLAVNAFTLQFDNDLVLASGVFLGGTLGFGTALAVMPRGHPLLPQRDMGSHAERGLAAYRSALVAEIAAGLRGAALMEKLRPLRTELDLSDRDHAVLEHAIRAQGGSESAETELAAGDILLGRYHIERLVGRGGGSHVYLARDERLDRRVALKRLSQDQRRDRAALERFQKETKLASALQHPNIVAIHDIEIVGNEAYLVMEYVAGGSVEERLREAPMDEGAVRRIASDVLAALRSLHEQGIHHRDVKPSNILLDSEGRAKLSDFSVARAVVSGDTVGFTGTGGAPVGTPAYMAPEQARGLPATAQSDLYSLGATLYAALTGASPISVEGLSEFEARIRVASDVPPLPLRDVSAQMNSVLSKAMARDPSDRYASAAQMLTDLAS